MPEKKFFLYVAVLCLVPLAACQTTSAGMERSARIDSALERAENEAIANGRAQESLAILARRYKRSRADSDLAVSYARALRQAGRLNRAALVIAPVAENNKEQNAEAKTEYAAILVDSGDYTMAEKFARQAVLLEPELGQPYHVLGITLDAQGYHKQAEVAFRRGLDYWQGDPSPVLNNLGLNLASQGFLDEAIDTLRKAAAMAPGRTEIERNLRIVSALQVKPAVGIVEDSTAPPIPVHKPEI